MYGRLFCLAFMMSALNASTLFADLPDDAPVVSEVIHKRIDALASENLIDAGISMTSGDKFLSTKGFSIRDTYYFSETFAVTGGLSFYTSSPTEEAQSLSASGVEPRMHDPSFMIRVAALYQPVYGKLAIGSTIIRFHLGIEAGVHGSQEGAVTANDSSSTTATSSDEEGGFVTGPHVGARLHIPISTHFSAIARGEYLLNGALETETSGRRLWETTLGVGYRL